jgi:hypothetical protein
MLPLMMEVVKLIMVEVTKLMLCCSECCWLFVLKINSASSASDASLPELHDEKTHPFIGENFLNPQKREAQLVTVQFYDCRNPVCKICLMTQFSSSQTYLFYATFLFSIFAICVV